MSIKKYANGAWTDTTYHKYGTETEIISAFPKQIIGDGQNIASYTISGNMIQNGTPAPDAPIYPQECGERAANLAPAISTVNGWRVGYLSNQGAYIDNNPCGEILSPMIPIAGLTAVTISATSYSSPSMSIYYFNGNTYITNQLSNNYDGSTFTDFPINATHFCFAIRTGYYTIESVTENGWHVMANSGNIAIPYEPYGYKIPTQSGGGTQNVYLDEPLRKIGDYEDSVASDGTVTRRTRKLVFDGDTVKFVSKAAAGSFVARFNDGKFHEVASACSHFAYSENNTEQYGKYFIPQSAQTNQWNFWLDSSKTIDEANEWISDQYSAGTPVTVWYVLATPTTETITVPTLQTTGTPENFDVSTTLKPSEVSLTYHGWHEHTDTKYTE